MQKHHLLVQSGRSTMAKTRRRIPVVEAGRSSVPHFLPSCFHFRPTTCRNSGDQVQSLGARKSSTSIITIELRHEPLSKISILFMLKQ
mmetsp:Transcript_11038/g.31988  ORF Transcript_11038/g.31988 Transcript_11038/m.31988 type:complete len:88 (-) Transcript_11038:156-419(-)